MKTEGIDQCAALSVSFHINRIELTVQSQLNLEIRSKLALFVLFFLDLFISLRNEPIDENIITELNFEVGRNLYAVGLCTLAEVPISQRH